MNNMKRIALFFVFAVFALPAPAQKPLKAGRTALKAARAPYAAPTARFKNLKEVRTAAKRYAFSSQTARLNTAALERSAVRAQQAAQTPPPDGQIFWALAGQDPNIRFSGTVFEIETNGKKEIFGVVAAHTIAIGNQIPGLGKHFIAVVFLKDDPQPHFIPAEIVAVSPANVSDIALVKFPKEGEKLLSPYPLGKITTEKTLDSTGYDQWGFVFLPKRLILKNTPYIIHTSMPLLRMERTGMCGSALLNRKEQLVGIHIGSRVDPLAPDAETYSYVTPSSQLRFLANAYLEGKTGTVPFYLAQEHSLPLAPNEYITSIQLQDANGKTLLTQKTVYRFSRALFKVALQKYPQAKFVRVTARKVTWSENGEVLQLGRSPRNTYKIYLYDLSKKEIVSVQDPKPFWLAGSPFFADPAE